MNKVNPFYYNLPVKPINFVGRWGQVKEIVIDLARGQADSWAIIGGRRFGKSSFLKALENRLLSRMDYLKENDWWVLPIPVDLKGGDTKSERNVYAHFMRMLSQTLRKNTRFFTSTVLIELDKYQGVEELSFYQFEDAIENLLSNINDNNKFFRFVFLVDEVETATNHPWCEVLFNQLRALIYDEPLANAIKLVLTGSSKVIQVRQEGSPLLNAVKIIHLKNLPATAIEDLIERGGRMPENATNEVKWTSGGHPYITQYLLHYLWKGDYSNATPELVRRVALQMRQNRESDLRGWWQAIDKSGQQIYELLVQADDWVDEKELITVLSEKSLYLDHGLTALCYHGLAIRNENLRSYRAVGNLFREWFFTNIPKNRKLTVNRSNIPSQTQIIVQGDFIASNTQSSDFLPEHLEEILAEFKQTLTTELEELKKGQAIIFQQMGEVSREQLNKIFSLVQSGNMQQAEMNLTLESIRRALRAIQATEVTLREGLKTHLLNYEEIIDSKLSVHHKVELTLPIIPVLLNYKAELGMGSNLDVISLFDNLEERWQSLLSRAINRK